MKSALMLIINALLVSVALSAQGAATTKQNIDLSKPTNLFTHINTNLEFQASKTQNLFGVRACIQHAFNPDNVSPLEVPFLNIDRTNKFGLVYTRFRYFNAVKCNISESFIAIAQLWLCTNL